MTREERIKEALKGRETAIMKKKAEMKKADGVVVGIKQDKDATTINKEELEEKDEIEAVLIINTTNVMDSHKDVHLPGLWNKSLNENRNIKLLQEHKMEFDKIIADGIDLKASARTFNWTDLGYNFEGKTEALMFDAIIKLSRNEFMFKQYIQGRVDNHSVGMNYVKIGFAADDKSESEYYANYEKYLPLIVNNKEAEENGYFYLVFEAKAIEGSAVPIGSNTLTPTHSIKSKPLLFEDTLTTLKSIIKPEQDPLNSFFNQLNL